MYRIKSKPASDVSNHLMEAAPEPGVAVSTCFTSRLQLGLFFRAARRLGFLGVAASLLATTLLIQCGGESLVLAESYGAMRTDTELKEALLQACVKSNSADKPILLQMGADWCTDCRRVEAMKQEAALSDELSHWVDVRINVGQYDRHPWIVEHFEVNSIARWIAMKPNPQTAQEGCNSDPTLWTVLQDTVLEPISDSSSLKTTAEVVSWLKQARQ